MVQQPIYAFKVFLTFVAAVNLTKNRNITDVAEILFAKIYKNVASASRRSSSNPYHLRKGISNILFQNNYNLLKQSFLVHKSDSLVPGKVLWVQPEPPPLALYILCSYIHTTDFV